MKAALLASGIALFFVSLWVGSWALGMYGVHHWSNFPIVVTMFLMCLGGIVLVVVSFHPGDAS